MNSKRQRLKTIEKRLPRPGQRLAIIVLDDTRRLPSGFDPDAFDRVIAIVPAEGVSLSLHAHVPLEDVRAKAPAVMTEAEFLAGIEELERRKRELLG